MWGVSGGGWGVSAGGGVFGCPLQSRVHEAVKNTDTSVCSKGSTETGTPLEVDGYVCMLSDWAGAEYLYDNIAPFSSTTLFTCSVLRTTPQSGISHARTQEHE